MRRRAWPLRRLAAATALLALLCCGPAGAQEPSVPLARDATAVRIIDASLRSVAPLQRESGLFDDATGRVVGGDGLPSLAFVALARAGEDGQEPARPSATLLAPAAVRGVGAAVAAGAASAGLTTTADPDPGSWRLTLARRTLARGSGSSVILRWPLAMTLGGHLEDLLVGDRGDLRSRALTWGRLHAAGIAGRPAARTADRCYQDPACFNNYKLADAVLNLELVRSGLRGTAARTRLRDPAALRRATLHWLGAILPGVAPPTARVTIPGRPPEVATILSDPGTRPLAYATLCTAWTLRAARLAGPSAPVGLRRLARRALWGLLGAAGPDGDLSWSGRGQGQAWTHAAALYAASAGAALFADTDPLLAARLRRLADVQLDALDARLRGGALQVLPSGNDQLAGLDHYYSVTGSTGLALTFLQLARGELPDASARRLPLPAEIDGAGMSDPDTGLVTRRAGLSWMGVRLRRDHPYDPRSDAGLVRAVRLLGGRWREQLPERPGPVARPGGPALRTPSGGPVLVIGATHFQPRATGVRALTGGVELHGIWQAARGGRVAGTWRYLAAASGVELRSTCPLGARIELTAWLPRRGVQRRDGGLLERAGYGLRVTPRPRIRTLVADYANSVQPDLRAYRIVTACTQPSMSATWSGGAGTPADPPVPAPGD